MAVPKISLLEEKPMATYECQMCGENTRRNKFLWVSKISDREITVCRECAYKSRFGTKTIKKAKKENKLEKQ